MVELFAAQTLMVDDGVNKTLQLFQPFNSQQTLSFPKGLF